MHPLFTFSLAAGSAAKAFAAQRSDAYGTAILVRPDSAFQSVNDLKGKNDARIVARLDIL